MNSPTAYSFAVLRYVHDVRTHEFLNVGVLFFAPEKGVVEFRHTRLPSRIARAFPGVRERDFTRLLREVAESFDRLRSHELPDDVLSIARLAVPSDASALQWSPVMAGLADDVTSACDSVYERFVARYEIGRTHRVRTDDELWRGIEPDFSLAGLSQRFTRVEIRGAAQRHGFPRALRPDGWRIVHPVSLDGRTEEDLREKAVHWAGRLFDLRKADADFRLFLILGAPPSVDLRPAFREAHDLMRDSADRERVSFTQEDGSGAVARQLALELNIMPMN